MKSSKSLKIVLNIEANGLTPDKIWAIACKDLVTGDVREWTYPIDWTNFLEYWGRVDCVIGHNIIGYDLPSLLRLIPGFIVPRLVVDTLVVSRLLDFSRDGGHSLRAWAGTLRLEKNEQPEFHWNNPALGPYCLENVLVTEKLYEVFLPYLNSPRWKPAIETEHFTATVLQQMHENGFYLDIDKVRKLRYNILEELDKLDAEIASAFPTESLIGTRDYTETYEIRHAQSKRF
jgi:DNA polymerase-1